MDMIWSTESLRATVFLPSDRCVSTTEADEWWCAITGSNSPSLKEERHLDRIYKIDGRLNESSSLLLNIQPGRIDWILYPTNDDSTASGPVTLKNETNENNKTFNEFIGEWLSTISFDVLRLALGLSLVHIEDKKANAFAVLSKYLPSLQLDNSSFDFIYVINRPRTSAVVNDLLINRLSKWSYLEIQKYIASDADDAFQHLCKLEIDINSHPSATAPIHHDSLKALFKEFYLLSQEIAEQGDVK